jgi:hypothetical protein
MAGTLLIWEEHAASSTMCQLLQERETLSPSHSCLDRCFLGVEHLDQGGALEPNVAGDRVRNRLTDGVRVIGDELNAIPRRSPVEVRVGATPEVGWFHHAGAEIAVVVLDLDQKRDGCLAVDQIADEFVRVEGFTRVGPAVESERGAIDAVDLEIVGQLAFARTITVVRDCDRIEAHGHVAMQCGAELALEVGAARPENVVIQGVGDQAADEGVEAGLGAAIAGPGDHVRAAGKGQIGVRVVYGRLGAGLYRPGDGGVVCDVDLEATAHSCDDRGTRGGGAVSTPQEGQSDHDKGEARACECDQRPWKVNELHVGYAILSEVDYRYAC